MAGNLYSQIIAAIFFRHYKAGDEQVAFDRQELADTAAELGFARPKNLGDITYSFRFRNKLPEKLRATAPAGFEWIIRKSGQSRYRFVLATEWAVAPNPHLLAIKVPDATPGMIERYALSDEQALLAKLRYNRLLDVFTGITTSSLQSHLRRGVQGIGQIETDEVYIGLDRFGAHYVLPVQAKGGRDRMSVVQIEQDLALCAQDFPGLICRPIGAQFMPGGVIALFEFMATDEGVKIAGERHYQLVPSDSLTVSEIESYRHASIQPGN